MTMRFAAAAVAGMLTIAVAGGVFYGVIFAEFLRSNITLEAMKSPPGFGWVALSHVPFGILLALVVRWRGVLTAAGGALTGGTLGFLMAASYNLSQYGTTHLWTLRLTLVEPLITMTMVAAAGAVVALVLRGRTARPTIGRPAAMLPGRGIAPR
jgi:hypothetical protein